MAPCLKCNVTLSSRELQWGSGCCNACYDAGCDACGGQLTNREIAYKTWLCNKCFDKKAKLCRLCGAAAAVPGGSCCPACAAKAAAPVAPKHCLGCNSAFAATDTHASRGLCNSCREKAQTTPLNTTPTYYATVHELQFFLESGTIPSNMKVRNIYGRVQAYGKEWTAADVAKRGILPLDKPTTFVLGPEGIEQLIGKKGFDVLAKVGLPTQCVVDVVKRGMKYGFVMFEAEPGMEPVAATWDGVASVVKAHYPYVWALLERHMPALSSFTYDEIKQRGGPDTSTRWYNLGNNPTNSYLKSKNTLTDARSFLAHELFCCELFTGTGWTRTQSGEPGMREYFSPNLELKRVKNWSFTEIKVSLADSEKAFPQPESWDWGGQQPTGCKVVEVGRGPEFDGIVQQVRATMPRAKVKKVERVQNNHLWQKYCHEKKVLEDWHGHAAKERALFHGTGCTGPDMIYGSELGFDMRFCTSGMWGVATYFAVNSSYSNGYAYTNPAGHKQFFLATVLVGDAFPSAPNGSLRMPPVKSTSGTSVVRYDSVTGNTGGSQVFMIYSNGRAYPSYLITYEE